MSTYPDLNACYGVAMRFLFSIAAIAVATMLPGMAAYAGVQPLLTPAQLDAVRDDASVRIIDIRPAADYSASHIPGAVSAPYSQWRGPANSPGQLLPVEKFTALARSLGLSANTHAIVVSSGANATDFGGSARVYWTLKYLGMSNLSILNGGVKAWVDAGLPQDQAVPVVQPSQYKPTLNKNLVALKNDVLAQVDNPSVRLVDARPAKFFEGQAKAPTAKVPGTIRNAVNLAHDSWFKPGTSIFVSQEEARKIASERFSEPAEETISFCNTGHWASTDWFALSEVVGQPNVRLYPASLAEWTQSEKALPMDNTPGRGEQILDTLKSLLGSKS